MERMDYYDLLPDGYSAYLSIYGHHFSKKMCEWAVSKMRDMSGNKVKMRAKEQVETAMRVHGVNVENDNGYDVVYVFNMCISDFLGSSIPDEARAAIYVKDLLDDRDGYPGIAFDRFIADCNAKGVPIVWSDMI